LDILNQIILAIALKRNLGYRRLNIETVLKTHNTEEELKKPMKKISKRLGNFFRFRSIQFIITASFAGIAVFAIIFIGIILSGKFSKTAEQNVDLSSRQVIEQVSLNLDNYQKELTGILDLIQRGISKTPNLTDKELEKRMDVILEMRDDIVSMAVFTDTGELAMGDPFSKLKNGVNISQQEWFIKALINSGENFVSGPHVQDLFEVKHNWVMSLSKAINLNYNGEEIQGVLLIDINFNALERLCQKAGFGKKGYVYVVDTSGNIIYHPHQQLIYAGLKKEENSEVINNSYGSFTNDERLLTIKSVGYTDWKVVGISYMDELTATKKSLTNFSLWISVLAIILVLLIVTLISAKITRPIKQLDRYMKKIEEGDFNINVEIKGDREVVHLSKTFNLMMARIRQLMDQIVVEQEAKRKSELNALQAQINPHFLYNTLDSIVWMAENGKIQDVITMVTSLARLFRISISRGKNIITVREELEHARNYLIIQKVRYKSKFQFEIEFDEEVSEYKTLKLLVQPILENALYHGIEYMVEEGFIKVSARILDGKLLYEVVDNGLGMKPEILENILSYNSTNIGGSGVGIKNVHERVQLCYGMEYGVGIDSELEVGTTVRICLPLIKDEGQGK
jgi:two-component system sensor histidine kinase YesM